MSNLFTGIAEHIALVSIAIVIAVILGVLLGVIAYWVKYLDSVILWFAEVMQTIPSLALLALLMIVFGLGDVTLIVGLVLYALLPIVRNTYTGLKAVSPHLKDAARGMGMSKMQRLFKVEIPLSFPLIFSGIKIALVNSLSVAVMGVLIGSGGLGEIIYRGIQSMDMKRILTGAIPVVIMALLFDVLMSKVEKQLVKRAK
ncbi:MAG TPA: ABC transporter permease [Oscillospiraceae bacterium]|nr:ABC transporter permease [Oscillospiraceae bacterium]